MKIGILTHYTVINQGAILQMYALKKWLEEKGHTVYILRYTKDFDFAPSEAGKYNISIKYIPFYFKEYVIKKGVGLSWFNVQKQLLYKKYINHSFQFRNYALDRMDAVIVGSDEVFSLAAGCNMMMYGHGVNSKHLISYAPSFGQTDINRVNDFRCKELISSGLKMFDYLSVRDEPSAKLVENLTGNKPEVVCDPVILYDFSRIHADISKFNLYDKKFILVYSMERWMIEPREIKAIKKYAENKKLVTVSAGTYHKWCDINIVCNPIEWLEIFRNASEVITDTFHGSVLSIITGKKTIYHIRPQNSNKLTDLIHTFHLEDRVCTNLSVKNIARIQKRKIDTKKLNEIIESERKKSEAFLLQALASIGKGD